MNSKEFCIESVGSWYQNKDYLTKNGYIGIIRLNRCLVKESQDELLEDINRIITKAISF